MKQVEFNTKGTNPFYGMSNTLSLYQNASKGVTPSRALLEGAWNESTTVEQLGVLLTVLFQVGDVTARQHNLFDGNVEKGGQSQREVFRDTIIPFLVEKTSEFDHDAKLRLISLIVEFTTLDNVVAARVKTQKGTNKYVNTIDMIQVFGVDLVAQYIANIIVNGTPFQKTCVAKFVTRPRFSKRAGRKNILPQTQNVMASRTALLVRVSKLANLHVTEKPNYLVFDGFYEWRKEFNSKFESVLFSTKAILNFDKEEFFELINSMPSDARFRLRNKVMFGEQWASLKAWYQEWETYKENKQAEQRQIEKAIEEGDTSEKTAAKLVKVKKEAKVTTGAVEFAQLFDQIVKRTVDRAKVQPFLDKINLPYNSLVFVDDSGSMTSVRSPYTFSARDFGAFMATIMLTKNPDPDARDLIGLFSSSCRMFNGVSSKNTSPNSLLRQNVVKTARQPLINAEDHFLDNLQRMRNFLDAESTWNGTYLSTITQYFASWATDSRKLEELQKYPIWTLISDGNFNNRYSAESSLNDFFRQCELHLGFKPFLILIDVARGTSADIVRFEGIDNVMMVPPNPANIEMLLTNFKDMDTYDVYTPLQSLSRSKRYAPLRDFINTALTKNVKKSLTIKG